MPQFNDRKAPRLGKAEFSTHIITEQLYQEWIKDTDQDINYSQFLKIWDSIADKVRNEIVINPMGIKLPFFCGEIKVQFLPKKIKGKDYDLSQKEKEELPFLNIITKGKVAKISWIRKNAYRFNQNIMLFAFEQSRLIGKNLNVALTENPQIYRNS